MTSDMDVLSVDDDGEKLERVYGTSGVVGITGGLPSDRSGGQHAIVHGRVQGLRGHLIHAGNGDDEVSDVPRRRDRRREYPGCSDDQRVELECWRATANSQAIARQPSRGRILVQVWPSPASQLLRRIRIRARCKRTLSVCRQYNQLSKTLGISAHVGDELLNRVFVGEQIRSHAP